MGHDTPVIRLVLEPEQNASQGSLPRLLNADGNRDGAAMAPCSADQQQSPTCSPLMEQCELKWLNSMPSGSNGGEPHVLSVSMKGPSCPGGAVQSAIGLCLIHCTVYRISQEGCPRADINSIRIQRLENSNELGLGDYKGHHYSI